MPHALDSGLDDEIDTVFDKVAVVRVARTRPRVDVLTVDGDLAISGMREQCSAKLIFQYQRATITAFLSGYLIVRKIGRDFDLF